MRTYHIKMTGYCDADLGTIKVEASSFEEAKKKAVQEWAKEINFSEVEPRYVYKMEQDNGNYCLADYEDIEYINGCIHTGHDVTTYRADITGMDIGDVDELYDQDDEIEWEAIDAYKA